MGVLVEQPSGVLDVVVWPLASFGALHFRPVYGDLQV